MQMKNINVYLGLVTMVVFLVMSFILKDVIISGLVIAFSIIIGAVLFRKLSNQ